MPIPCLLEIEVCVRSEQIEIIPVILSRERTAAEDVRSTVAYLRTGSIVMILSTENAVCTVADERAVRAEVIIASNISFEAVADL